MKKYVEHILLLRAALLLLLSVAEIVCRLRGISNFLLAPIFVLWLILTVPLIPTVTRIYFGDTKAEPWLVSLSFWIPRKYREPITGDIFEDCHEMRELGFGEWRICIQVLWQFMIAVIALWPEAIGSAVAAIVKHIWSIKK